MTRHAAAGRLSLLLMLALCACMPRLQPEGPVVSRPAIGADRLAMDDGVGLPFSQWLKTFPA